MLTKLTLEHFKNFNNAELLLGPVTSLIGTNASGKSNLRDAFRFLHGVGRGYTLAEIMGEKYGEGGELQWKGIRGGTREAAYFREKRFKLTVEGMLPERKIPLSFIYSITVQPGELNERSRVIQESLFVESKMVFITQVADLPHSSENMFVQFSPDSSVLLRPFQPFLTQIIDYAEEDNSIIVDTLAVLTSMRFFDLHPQSMRFPSLPGQIVLGDRGENLSSVLQNICDDPHQKNVLLEWLRELTPMDVVDFEFPADQTGRILVTFVEEQGRKISAYSASDGTLRFLAIIAALLTPRSAKFLFFEELENGLHPSRVHLLLQLMERKAAEGKIQIVNTTHSPQFLRFLSTNALEHASLTYRLPETPEGRIQRIVDIPEARRLIAEQDIAHLHESGWFEDAMFFDSEEATE